MPRRFWMRAVLISSAAEHARPIGIATVAQQETTVVRNYAMQSSEV
jgi:hypothetical protein